MLTSGVKILPSWANLKVIITSFCCAALAVFISVCQKRLEAKGKAQLASYIDNIMLIFYPVIYVFLVSIEILIH